ncbi:hypothetical protein TNCV_2004141 [Trichonephila clavipes]|nr:hypothetical protein TNCV_2004141 [Trichonephila clavipes]
MTEVKLALYHDEFHAQLSDAIDRIALETTSQPGYHGHKITGSAANNFFITLDQWSSNCTPWKHGVSRGIPRGSTRHT